MAISIFLAKLFGLYLIIKSLIVLTRKEQIINIAEQYIRNKPLVLMTAAMTTFLGIALIILHNTWVLDWRLIVTLIAWDIAIQGVIIFLFPESLEDILKLFSKKSVVISVALITLALGVYLTYSGFTVAA